MTKPSRPRRAEREGTVRALRDTGLRATSELPGTTGTPHPRYRMTEMPLCLKEFQEHLAQLVEAVVLVHGQTKLLSVKNKLRPG